MKIKDISNLNFEDMLNSGLITSEAYEAINNKIEEIPSIDVDEAGYWIKATRYICPVCGCEHGKPYEKCFRCGRKMYERGE